MALEVTEAAVDKVTSLIHENKLIPKDTLLRLIIKGETEKGCEYGLGLDYRKDNIHHLYDTFFSLGEFDLVLDDDALGKTDGFTIDYNNGFEIKSPTGE